MRAILTYHSIDSSGSPISVDPEAFDQHVSWLRSDQIKVTTVEQLLSLPASVDAVAITFDDAFVNFEDVAAPRLLAHGLPVTLFVVTDRVGTSNAWEGRRPRGIPHLPLLDWAALARLQARGVVLGAHSRTHRDLTRLGMAAVEDEVRGSADLIEQETGTRPTAFAYPYGRTSDQAAHIVAREYSCACTTEFRTLDDGVALERLPRLDMYYFQRRGRIQGWGSAGLDRFISARRRLRRVRQWVADLRS